MTHYVTWTDMVKKNGKGFYNYVEGSRAPHPAPENEAIYEQVSKDNGFEREKYLIRRSLIDAYWP